MRAAEAFSDVWQRHARSRAHDGVFDGIANEWIAKRDDENNHQRAKACFCISKKNRGERAEKNGQNKPLHRAVAAAQNRHEPIEKRIAQRMVDEIKNVCVERL